MTDVVVTGTLDGQREFLYAKDDGRYEASTALWVEIETAIAFGSTVFIGTAPTGEDRLVSRTDPETLAAVAYSVPGFVPDIPPVTAPVEPLDPAASY